MGDLYVSDVVEGQVRRLKRQHKIDGTRDNRQLVRESQTIILAVKPQGMAGVLEEIRPEVTPRKLFVSIAAGRRLASFEKFVPGAAVVRAMPNTPAAIRRGITVAVGNKRVTPVQRAFAERHGVRLFGEVERDGQAAGSEAICHNKVIEDLALPGELVVGTDSHTCMAGVLGCLAFGVGSTDMANAWLTRDVRVDVPESVRVRLTGALSPGVCAKDVMLRLLGFSSSQEALRWERSGRARDSTLMTSAPSAARYFVQIGPAITQLKSTIRTPSSGFAEEAPTPSPSPVRGRGEILGSCSPLSGGRERGAGGVRASLCISLASAIRAASYPRRSP